MAADELLLGRVVIERRMSGDDEAYVHVHTEDAGGEPLEVFEVVGMLEMAKIIAGSTVCVEDV